MAKKQTTKPKENKSTFTVTEKIDGSINNKKYTANVGDIVQFDNFEALIFKNHIKES